jgi:putative tryptophan/tyrosine transport system substrate-binding protein
MASHIGRRKFLATVGGAAAAWPLAARAQQQAMPVVGFLRSSTLADAAHLVTAFRQGLKEAGFVEGQNVAVEYRSAEGRPDRLPALVGDLVRRPVAVIVANTTAALPAKAATTTVPIVFATGGDPLADGLVNSLNRPGGNITGVSFLGSALGAKQLELLRQLVPKATVLAALVDPVRIDPTAQIQLRNVQEAARSVGLQLRVLKASNEREIDAAFASLIQQRADALITGGGAFFFSRRNQISALAMRYAVPAIYPLRDFPAAGGLMSYGASNTDAYRQVGVYTGRILKGEKPAELPVLQPTKFELVINLTTAKVIGLDVPDRLLALADEVIE